MGPLQFIASSSLPTGLALDRSSGLIQVSSILRGRMLAGVRCSTELEFEGGLLMLRFLQGTIKETGVAWQGTITVENKRGATKRFPLSLAEGTRRQQDQHDQVPLDCASFFQCPRTRH